MAREQPKLSFEEIQAIARAPLPAVQVQPAGHWAGASTGRPVLERQHAGDENDIGMTVEEFFYYSGISAHTEFVEDHRGRR